MATLTLQKKETGNPAQPFLYSIVDESGSVLFSRGSKRDYVAATVNGRFFFGRLDLIGKGDHGKAVRHYEEVLANPNHPWRNQSYGLQTDEDVRKSLEKLQPVYLQDTFEDFERDYTKDYDY